MGMQIKRTVILLMVLAAITGVVLLKKSRTGSVSSIPVHTPGLPRLLDLGSEGCTACTLLEPVLDELRSTFAGQLQVDFIDVWQHEEVATGYGVEIIPVQIFFDAQGNELYRHQGFISAADVVSTFNDLGIPLHGE
jgi:thioredoxin 1